MRPAVDGHDDGRALAGGHAGRPGQERLPLAAAFGGKRERLDRGRRARGEQLAVQGGDRPRAG